MTVAMSLEANEDCETLEICETAVGDQVSFYKHLLDEPRMNARVRSCLLGLSDVTGLLQYQISILREYGCK